MWQWGDIRECGGECSAMWLGSFTEAGAAIFLGSDEEIS